MRARGLLLAFTLGSTPLRAAELGVAECAELDETTLREHLDLELDTLGLGGVRVLVRVDCEHDAARVELWRGGTRLAHPLRVSWGDTARAARERLVALAASELVAQAERARLANASPIEPSPPTTRRAPPEARLAARTEARGRFVELSAAATLGRAGEPGTTLGGGSIGTALGLGLGRGWALTFDTRFERGRLSLRELDVRWSLLSGFAGGAVDLDLAAVGLRAGVGVRAGWLALEGGSARSPYTAQSFTAPWLGVAAPLRIGAELGLGVTPFAGAELGWVMTPVSGRAEDGAELTGHHGPWLTASVGVGIALR